MSLLLVRKRVVPEKSENSKPERGNGDVRARENQTDARNNATTRTNGERPLVVCRLPAVEPAPLLARIIFFAERL